MKFGRVFIYHPYAPMPTMELPTGVQHKHENQILVLDGKLRNPLVEFTIEVAKFR
jgi:hypothetical protein